MGWNSHWSMSTPEQVVCGTDEDSERQRNDAVDRFMAPVFMSAMDKHANLHTNAKRLHSKYHIPLTEVRHIIKSCDVCAPLHLHTSFRS